MNAKFIAILLLIALLLAVLAGCTKAETGITSPIASITPSNLPASPITTSESITTAFTTPPVPTSSPVPTLTLSQAPIPVVNPPIIDGTVVIELSIGAFTPALVWIPAGTYVEWRTEDHLSVHAVAGEDFVRWGAVVYWQPFRMQFNTPGTYHYLDDADPTVRGTIVVF